LEKQGGSTGVARNFAWEGPKMEKNFKLFFFKVWFHHNQFEKPQFGQITQLYVTKIED